MYTPSAIPKQRPKGGDRRPWVKQQGVTLVEFLMAMALMTLIVGATLMIFEAQLGLNDSGVDQTSAQNACRQILTVLGEDLRESREVYRTSPRSDFLTGNTLNLDQIEMEKTTGEVITYPMIPNPSGTNQVFRRVNGSGDWYIADFVTAVTITRVGSRFFKVIVRVRSHDQEFELSTQINSRSQ